MPSHLLLSRRLSFNLKSTHPPFSKYEDNYRLLGKTGTPIQNMILNNDANTLITTHGNKLKYWELEYDDYNKLKSLQLFFDRKAHDLKIEKICHHPILDLLITSGKEQVIKFWNMKNGRLLTQLYFLKGDSHYSETYYENYDGTFNYHSEDYFFLHNDGTFSGNEIGLKSLLELKREKYVPMNSSNKNYARNFSIINSK